MNRSIAIMVGGLLSLLSILLHRLLNMEQQMELLSSIMVLIGSVYFGFAFKARKKITRFIEISTAAIFVSMGMLGLWISPWVLFAALLLHDIWDLLHHNSAILVKIPEWYLPFCATYDWLMAAYLFYLIY